MWTTWPWDVSKITSGVHFWGPAVSQIFEKWHFFHPNRCSFGPIFTKIWLHGDSDIYFRKTAILLMSELKYVILTSQKVEKRVFFTYHKMLVKCTSPRFASHTVITRPHTDAHLGSRDPQAYRNIFFNFTYLLASCPFFTSDPSCPLEKTWFFKMCFDDIFDFIL